MPLTDPVAVFTVVVVVLLAAPLVARRGVPSSVVLLVAGVALGPHALGVLDRDATIVLLGTIGLLYIMFLAGLEIDLHELSEGRARSLGFGFATFALPQLVGTAVARLALGLGWPAAVLLGSVFASHTLLAYPAAARLGLQKERAVTAAVGATILTDTLALLVLAVVATGAREGAGFDGGVLVRVSLSLVAFGAVVLWGLPRVGAWFFRTAASDAALEFLFVLAAVFVCALGVEALGVEPIIGAFLAGLGLNRLVPAGGPLMNRVSFVGGALFIPFFLLSTGMLVDLGAFAGGPGAGRAWTVALAMTATLLATKGAAAWSTRPAFGFSAVEAQVVFGLTVPQAAATLAAVLVGVEVGLFDGAVLNGTILMVLVTCLVGPFVVERAGRRLAARAERPASEEREGRRVLVTVSNPATVGTLVDLAVLVRGGRGEPLTAVTVVARGPDEAEGVSRAERLLEQAVVHAAGADVAVLPLVRVEANVARAIARTVAGTRSSLVVTGWDGSPGAERVLFGTLPDRVLRETSAAVLVSREARPPATLRRLVVAAPPLAARGPGVEGALRLVAALAGRIGARVVLATAHAAEAELGAAYARVPGAQPAGRIALDVWDRIPDRLGPSVRPDDGLVLLSARAGTLAWDPGLGRLPRALAERFPAHSLFVLYPGEIPAAPVRPDRLTDADRALLDALTPERVHLDDDALAEWTDEAEAVVVEVRPGVVLVRASEPPGAPSLKVGTSREGRPAAGVSAPLDLAVRLGVPAGTPSATTLGWLALVARLLGDDAAVEAARAARTEPEMVAALRDAARRIPAQTGT